MKGKVSTQVLLIFFTVAVFTGCTNKSVQSQYAPTTKTTELNPSPTLINGLEERTEENLFEIDPTIEVPPSDSITELLLHIKYKTIDINNMAFYSHVTSKISPANEDKYSLNYLLLEQYFYQGELFRFPEFARYTVSIDKEERDQDGHILNQYIDRMNYTIDNETIYFGDDFGTLNYYSIDKELGFLETVGQLEKIADFFIEHESLVQTYTFEDRTYVNLTLDEAVFIEHLPLLTETVFNGYFNTIIKTDDELVEADPMLLNWPNTMNEQLITIILNADNQIESYYVTFTTPPYDFEQNYLYHFTLMTSFFDINQLSFTNKSDE